MFYVNLVNL